MSEKKEEGVLQLEGKPEDCAQVIHVVQDCEQGEEGKGDAHSHWNVRGHLEAQGGTEGVEEETPHDEGERRSKRCSHELYLIAVELE